MKCTEPLIIKTFLIREIHAKSAQTTIIFAALKLCWQVYKMLRLSLVHEPLCRDATWHIHPMNELD